MHKKMHLKEVLYELYNLDENFDVFFNDQIDEMSANTECEVYKNEDFDVDSLSLSIAQIVDIVENLKQQKNYPPIKEIIEGIIFYMENDSFIKVS